VEYSAVFTGSYVLSVSKRLRRNIIRVAHMSIREWSRRIEKLERKAAELASSFSRSSEECICFPEKEEPSFGFLIEGDIAFLVKCPLHGDRFQWPQQHNVYVPSWMRENIRQGWPAQRSPQYRKAWASSFPSDLWPAEEESVQGSLYIRLKDGTRLDSSSRLY